VALTVPAHAVPDRPTGADAPPDPPDPLDPLDPPDSIDSPDPVDPLDPPGAAPAGAVTLTCLLQMIDTSVLGLCSRWLTSR
jgi:hypothetical protein